MSWKESSNGGNVTDYKERNHRSEGVLHAIRIESETMYIMRNILAGDKRGLLQWELCLIIVCSYPSSYVSCATTPQAVSFQTGKHNRNFQKFPSIISWRKRQISVLKKRKEWFMWLVSSSLTLQIILEGIPSHSNIHFFATYLKIFTKLNDNGKIRCYEILLSSINHSGIFWNLDLD